MSAITAAVFVQHKMNVFKTVKSTNISIKKSAKTAILVVQKMVVVMILKNVTYVIKENAKSVKIMMLITVPNV